MVHITTLNILKQLNFFN